MTSTDPLCRTNANLNDTAKLDHARIYGQANGGRAEVITASDRARELGEESVPGAA